MAHVPKPNMTKLHIRSPRFLRGGVVFNALRRVIAGGTLFCLGWALAWWADSNENQHQRIGLEHWEFTLASAGTDRDFLLASFQSDEQFVDRLEYFSNSVGLFEAFKRNDCNIASMDRAERTSLVFFGPYRYEKGQLVRIRDPALEGLYLQGRTRPHTLEVCDIDNDGWPAIKLIGFDDKVLAANASLECIVLTQESG